MDLIETEIQIQKRNKVTNAIWESGQIIEVAAYVKHLKVQEIAYGCWQAPELVEMNVQNFQGPKLTNWWGQPCNLVQVQI